MQNSIYFFQKVKRLREEKGISQVKMAEALNIVQSAYNKLENGVSTPTLEQVYKISETLETPISKLLPNSNYINQHNENFNNCTVIGIDNFNLTIEKVEELKNYLDDFLNKIKTN